MLRFRHREEWKDEEKYAKTKEWTGKKNEVKAMQDIKVRWDKNKVHKIYSRIKMRDNLNYAPSNSPDKLWTKDPLATEA